MLDMIHQDGFNYKKYVDLAKDKDSAVRLMGFGHRVYKNFDPRAIILRKVADDVLQQMGINDPLLEIAKQLEDVALKDDYFIERKLYPNVDFYSGIIYRAMGIDPAIQLLDHRGRPTSVLDDPSPISELL